MGGSPGGGRRPRDGDAAPGAEAGLRRGEVAQVHARDVILIGGSARLVVHGKGGRQRMVPISGELGAVLRRGVAGHTPGAANIGWLFLNPVGGHLRPRSVGIMLNRLIPDGYRMHTLRHRAVQTLLGLATTERYVGVDDDEIRAAAASAW